MTEYSTRLPQYLHLPFYFLWFDVIEWVIIVLSYILGVGLLSGVYYILIFLIPFLSIRYKRSKSRGYFNHLRYKFGFSNLEGYPLPDSLTFNE